MRKNQSTIMVLFIFLMIIIYSDLMIFHQFFSTKILQYTAVLVCFMMTLILPNRTLDWLFVTTALLFTVISDTFLVLLEGYQLIAVISFCVVQLLYAIRLWYSDQYRFTHNVIFRIIFLVLMEILAYAVLKEKYDFLILITIFYLSLLIGNIVHAITFKKEQALFLVALILFLLCDLVVGLSVSDNYLSISSYAIIGRILDIPINLAWFFYLPSQVLIVLSVYLRPKRVEK